MSRVDIKKVEYFWNANPCGLIFFDDTKDKKKIFEETEKERYTKQAKILSYANFERYKDKRVVEIGCGIGTDAIQFARHGAIYTGVDLTERAVEITKERFKLFGQKGQIIQVNAEKLPFPDNYFDYVYSFGVIHHSVSPAQIVNEIYRVLKPQGTVTIMLYNKTSFYYFIEVKIIRRIFFIFCDKKNFCKMLFSLFNNKLAARFESFRRKLEEMKTINSAPTADEWISMNTDDVFCPIARVYSRLDTEKLFIKFQDFKSDVWFIDKDNWFLWLIFGKFIPRQIENWLEAHYGWFRMVNAHKPDGIGASVTA